MELVQEIAATDPVALVANIFADTAGASAAALAATTSAVETAVAVLAQKNLAVTVEVLVVVRLVAPSAVGEACRSAAAATALSELAVGTAGVLVAAAFADLACLLAVAMEQVPATETMAMESEEVTVMVAEELDFLAAAVMAKESAQVTTRMPVVEISALLAAAVILEMASAD